MSEALTRSHDAGFLLVVVTNQPDIARGTTSTEAVDRLNGELTRRIDDLAARLMVGDRWRDVEAGHNADCRTVFVD